MSFVLVFFLYERFAIRVTVFFPGNLAQNVVSFFLSMLRVMEVKTI